MNIQKLPVSEFRAIYNRVPRLCIDLIIEKESKVLLIERTIDPGRGQWHLPGGTVLLGESILMAAERIVKEETGLVVKKIDLLGVMEFSKSENPFFHTVSIVHQCICANGNVRGSFQGKNLKFSNLIPQAMIEEQKIFLHNHLGMKLENNG